jgi:hypothetical protein
LKPYKLEQAERQPQQSLIVVAHRQMRISLLIMDEVVQVGHKVPEARPLIALVLLKLLVVPVAKDSQVQAGVVVLVVI